MRYYTVIFHPTVVLMKKKIFIQLIGYQRNAAAAVLLYLFLITQQSPGIGCLLIAKNLIKSRVKRLLLSLMQAAALAVLCTHNGMVLLY